MKVLILILLLSPILTFGQIERSLINVAGRTAKNLNFSFNQQRRIEYAIGEPITFTQLTNGKRINNGFIQPTSNLPLSSGGSTVTNSTALIAHIFPNPNDGSFTIELNSPPLDYYAVQLIDLRGRLIEVYRMEETTLRITKIALPTGIYLLNFYDSKGTFLLQKNISIL
jgi:hypothetical protein